MTLSVPVCSRSRSCQKANFTPNERINLSVKVFVEIQSYWRAKLGGNTHRLPIVIIKLTR